VYVEGRTARDCSLRQLAVDFYVYDLEMEWIFGHWEHFLEEMLGEVVVAVTVSEVDEQGWLERDCFVEEKNVKDRVGQRS
jgi:hypothetical protein